MLDLSELTAVVGEEVAIGRDLLNNLAAQREAILGWKIGELIERIESRESLFSSLANLERRRRRLIGVITGEDREDLTLTEIIAGNPSAENISDLERLQKDARKLYTRLHAEEKSLLGLMENLLGHIHEALSPLAAPEVALYGITAPSARVSSGLIQGKA
jgi:hypothetical protein